jgi:hypothetical protein
MPTEGKNDFLYGDLTYKINGILIEIHKELGPYAREKQVCDLIAAKFKERGVNYQREVRIGDSGNIADFIVDGKIILDLKNCSFLEE